MKEEFFERRVSQRHPGKTHVQCGNAYRVFASVAWEIGPTVSSEQGQIPTRATRRMILKCSQPLGALRAALWGTLFLPKVRGYQLPGASPFQWSRPGVAPPPYAQLQDLALQWCSADFLSCKQFFSGTVYIFLGG